MLVSAPDELLWAIIGLLLTILGTFIEVLTLNPPWNWAAQGIEIHSLGISYQIAAVLLAGCLGGRNAGAVSQIAYLLVGLYWFPVFTKGGGFGYILEPSFGYVLGFIPGAWLCGWLAFRNRPQVESLTLSALAGLGIIHLVGLIYLTSLLGFTGRIQELLITIQEFSINPLPGQLGVVCLVGVIAFLIRKMLFY